MPFDAPRILRFAAPPAAPPRSVAPAGPAAPGWSERWTLAYGHILLPVELYVSALAPEVLPAAASLAVRPAGALAPIHLALRFGSERAAGA